MEILSDAVFHGNVEFKTKITLPNGCVGAGNLAERSEFVITDNSIKVGQVGASYIFSRGQITTGCGSIVIGTFSGSHDNYSPIGENQFSQTRTITFPSSAGTLALTSQIPSLSGYLTTSAAASTYLSKTEAESLYTRIKYIPIDFDVPASCTKFTVPTGLSGSFDIGSMAMFRCVDTSDLGYKHPNDQLFKQVSVDLYQIGCSHTILVEKSSSFAIGSSDGYELRLAYYR